MEKRKENFLTEQVIGAAIDVHKELGPGLLESAYETCLVYELGLRGIPLERQKPIGITYKGVPIDCGYRLDLLVDNSVIVELKAVERFAPVHKAQLITYLKLANCRLGLLLNFNCKLMRQGIQRVVLGF